MTKTTTKAATAKPVKTAEKPTQGPAESALVATEDVAKVETPEAEAEVTTALNYAQALLLPEVPADAKTLPVSLAGDSVHAFKSADRRTMRVVRTAEGLAAQAIAD